MKQTGKRLCALLLTAAMALSMLPAVAFAAAGDDPEGRPLINPGLHVEASSQDEVYGSTKEKAIDGNLGTQWSSENMKDSATLEANGGNQKPQWLMVDLGEEHTYPIAIDAIKLCYNAKVWPMVYRVETSATGEENGEWTTLVFVSRDPFNGGVTNGEDQDIASEPDPDDTGSYGPATENGENYDFITKTSSPALDESAEVQRYVRIYIEQVNTAAPGNNTGLREFQIYAPAPEPIEGAWNLALNQPTAASDHDGASTSDKAVDGNTSTSQWSSGDMKTGEENADPNARQDHQWLWVDLGYTGSRINEIKLYYNMKVWPMVYEIQTTDDDPTAQGTVWDTVVRVERSPFAGAVKNGVGQNIADETGNDTPSTAANTDTITATSAPALWTTTLKRYVRIYIEKVNTSAPGNNTGLREVEIYGVNDNRHKPVDVNAVLSSATADNVTASGSAVTVPAAPAGAGLAVVGSVLENVVANDGSIGGKNIGARDVTLLIRAWDEYDSSVSAQKNLTVTVPDHKGSYPAEWFPAVTNANAKPEVIPAIQEWYGYEGNFELSDSSRIVINDMANVGLRKAAENMQADVLEISGIDLDIVEGTSGGASDIYIESLAADSYDLGKEGYLMRVSDEGIKIYAPTYTGCIFGTITVEQILWQAEDHLSVPKGIMRDYPAYEVRGIKLDIARTPYRYQQLKDYAKIMLWYKMSEYDLHINDNDNAHISSNNATFDTHSGFHRLESETFPSLTSGTKHAGIPQDLVNADYYNNNEDYQGNPMYTKEQWRDLEQLAKDYGMYLLTEIDLPAHSLVYNKYAQENPDNIEWLEGGIMAAEDIDSGNASYLELMDLTGANKDRALRFAKELWNEYTSGSEPTIYGDIVHIGADEYWAHDADTNNAFARFADEMRKIIQGNLGAGTRIRMWGASAGSSSFSTATTTLGMTHEELAQHFQLDIWFPSYDNAAQRAKEGYGVVNCRDCFLYGNPGRAFRDVPNAEYLFNNWNPTMFGGGNPLLGEPNLLGAKAVIWGDQSQEGMTERDIHQRVLRTIAIVSEKTWGGATQSEGAFSDYELRAGRLAEGPGTQIAMEIPSETSLVLDYDFTNVSSDGGIVYDASGNGYDAGLTGGTVDGDGWLAFDGSTLLATGLKTLSYPYTVSFKLKADAGNTAESSLFSGYDGRIQVAGHGGHMSADVNYFTRDFNYTAPTDGTAVDITIVGTQHATRLYVNGQLVTFLSQKADNDGVAPGNVQTLYSSVPLPLEKIGQDFHGSLASIKVYNKAFSAAEVAAAYAGTDDGLVNVAQNAIAGGSSPQGDNDNAVQRVCIAAKAIDGEDFTDAAATDTNSTEMWSYWRADGSSNSLTVDLGQTRTISSVVAHWRGSAPGSSLQTSADGSVWADFTNGTTVNARYVKLTTSGAGNLQELLVYENVSAKKTELASSLEKAEEVAEFRGLGFESTEPADQADFADVVFARAVKDNPLATIADVQRAIDGLVDQLVVPPVDLTELQAAYDAAKDVTNEDYTDASWTAFETARNSAKEILDAEGAGRTQKQINDAVTVLTAAQAGLTKDSGSESPSPSPSPSGTPDVPVISDIPGEPTPSRPGDDTRTEVRENEDGSTTTTVTDNKTGTVTETTEKEDGTVEVVETRKDGTVTATVTDAEGGKVEKVTTPDEDVTITVTDAEGEVLAKLEIPAEIPESETRFVDVPEGHWADEAIHNMAALEFVKGEGDNTFNRSGDMKRGDLALVLSRMSNTGEDYELPFTDVPAGKYYANGVAWAAKTGVVTGRSAETFAPEDTITREELAVMLYRYAKLLKLDAEASGDALDSFKDGGDTHDWAEEGMAWCVDKGILQGKGNGVLDPRTNVTRAEVAVMLQRFMDLLK